MLQEFNNEAELLLCDVAINYDDTPIDSGKFCILLLIGFYLIMLCDICWPICDVIAVVCLFLLFLFLLYHLVLVHVFFYGCFSAG